MVIFPIGFSLFVSSAVCDFSFFPFVLFLFCFLLFCRVLLLVFDQNENGNVIRLCNHNYLKLTKNKSVSFYHLLQMRQYRICSKGVRLSTHSVADYSYSVKLK